jgi:LuxR family maltose regulon positive regulatory protein
MALDITDPRLVLKATPPKAPKSALVRERLGIASPELADKSVIAVTAASGFGKTSLLAQWRREALKAGCLVAWLTLDASDDDARFAQGLAVAMQVGSGRPRFGHSYLPVPRRDGTQEGVTGWLAEVVQLAAEIVLILDDVHALPEATASGSLVYLLHNAPANLKIVLASRRPLALPVSDLLARGQFASLDADTLRFWPSETIAVLNARFGARIDYDSCVRLHELTEGWPLGLQLAIAKIEKSQDIRDAIAGCFVCSGDIRRFFVESLVDRLSPREAQFLVCVSFVDALHPGLCRAITQFDDAERILADLCEVTPIFAEGVDSAWMRIHPLAREFLSERFDALPDDEKRQLRRRAAGWLAEHKLYEEAGRHALRAGQEDLAYEFAERCLYDVLVTGQLSRVSEWLDHIPAAELERRPRLRLAVSWILAQSDRHAEAALMVGPINDDPRADAGLRCESAEICGTAALFADDLDTMARIVSPWFDALATRSPLQRLVGTNQLALLTLVQGAPERARYLFRQVARGTEAAGGYALGWADWIVGLSYWWEGQVILGEEELRGSLARAEERSGRRNPVAVMLGAVLAAVLWERNAPGEIAALLADRVDVLEHHTAPDTIILGHITAARVAAQAGFERRAYDVLGNLMALGEGRRLPRLCIASLAEQVRMHALRGRVGACAALIGRLMGVTPARGSGGWGMLESIVELQTGVAHAYAHIARMEWEKAIRCLDAAGPLADRLGRGRDRIQIQLLKALSLRRDGNDSEGLFAEALGMAETLGLERIVADTHPDLIDWAKRTRSGQAAATTGSHSPEAAIPAPTPSRPRAAAQASVAPTALLTPKERDVLRLLARNISNKEIAIALDVGPETVKWHLKNLFGKLYVTSRKQLLDRARLLGILEAVA